jgi:signal transduction histidine kinase
MNAVLPFELILTVGTSIAVFTLGCFIWARARTAVGSLTFGLIAMCLAVWTSADWFLHLESTALSYQVLVWKVIFYLSVFFAPGLALRTAAHVGGHVRLQSSIFAYFFSLFGFGALTAAILFKTFGMEARFVSALLTAGSVLGLVLYVVAAIVVCTVLYPALLSHRSSPLMQRRASYAIVILLPFLLAGGLQLLSGPIPTGFLMPILCSLFILISLLAFLRSGFLDVRLGALEAFFIPLISGTLVTLLRSRDLNEFVVFLGISLAIGVYGALAIQSVAAERDKRLSSEEAMRQLQRLDEARHDFVNMVAHQLRTPLAGIRGAASMLQQGDFGVLPKPAVDASNQISELAERLLSLSETFLNASRVDMGAFSSKLSEVQLPELFASVAREMEVPVQTKKLTLTFHLDASIPSVFTVDREVLKNALFNLVDNAVKYTSHGFVRVEASFEANLLHIAVTDSGQGMDAEDVHGLFQKFHRGVVARGSDKDGTGLGLYVVRQLVEAAGGRVTGESAGVGKGSTFRVTLPAHVIDDTIAKR